MSSTQFTILIASILAAGALIAAAIANANRDPTPEEAAKRIVDTGLAVAQDIDARTTEAASEITRNSIQVIALSITMFQAESGDQLPPDLDALTRPAYRGATPLIVDTEIFYDRWGERILYTSSAADSYTLRSMGPDGRLGTHDDIVWQGSRDSRGFR